MHGIYGWRFIRFNTEEGWKNPRAYIKYNYFCGE